eukprot:1160384-Pelagomonas_calceolata.AAC.5
MLEVHCACRQRAVKAEDHAQWRNSCSVQSPHDQRESKGSSDEEMLMQWALCPRTCCESNGCSMISVRAKD